MSKQRMPAQIRRLYGFTGLTSFQLAGASWVALLAARGIPYHRVHDVAGCAQALRLVEAMTPLA